MDGVFVTGVDTGVGKTTFSAGLLKLIHGTRQVCYWKPIQTGTILGDDTKEVVRLTDLSADNFSEPVYRFPDPLSPHWAAKKWGKTVDVELMLRAFEEKKKSGAFLIIEGAGGLLVPFNAETLQIDFIKKTGLSVILVTEDRVGAINQTLLSINACRDQKIPILGIIMTKSRRNLGNAEAIVHFGKVEILAQFDPAEDLRTLVGQVGAHPRLRELFQIGALPS